ILPPPTSGVDTRYTCNPFPASLASGRYQRRVAENRSGNGARGSCFTATGMVAGAKVVVVVDRSVGAPQEQVLQITQRITFANPDFPCICMPGGTHV